MKLHAAVAAALLTLAGADAALADMHIRLDTGGRIDAYLHRYAVVRKSGQRVIVDGPCLSACTILLGTIPKDRICVTGRAAFGFHAAWVPVGRGRQAPSALGDRMLWANYPEPVRDWITRHGGLTKRIIYLRGRELTALYPACLNPVIASGAKQ
ncbi:MAG TPA: hypothetical protein VK456_09695 [Xanthobacteraceae bacterium]|nr:hypothetical protein [Xanthobacteraceae bacterium]